MRRLRKFLWFLAVSGAPSKYLIGLLNFAGRTFSAIGTLMLVQVIVTFCRRRKGKCMRGGTSGTADDMLADQLQDQSAGAVETIGTKMPSISFKSLKFQANVLWGAS